MGVLARVAALFAALALVITPAAEAQGQAPEQPRLDATSWLLIDARDGDRLAAKSPNARRSIASLTKLMTTYVGLRELPLDRELTVPRYDALPAESVAGLNEGERLTLADLVTAMMLPSANDAAATVAAGVAGSEEAFVRRMNAAAAKLGLRGSSFANPIGLDQPGNYSTASDLATLALELRENRFFRRIVDEPEEQLSSGEVPRTVVTRNTLLLADPSVDGIKTGHTLGAGYVLVASAERRGVPLLSVVLGTASEAARDAETQELLDFGYSLYEERSPFEPGEELDEATVRYEDEPLALVAERELAVQARADEDLRAEVEAPEEVEGPIERGERIGRATVLLDDRAVGTVPLIAARAIAEPTLVDRVGGPGVVVAAALLLIVILIVAAYLVIRRRGLGREAKRSAEDRMRSRYERDRRRDDG